MTIWKYTIGTSGEFRVEMPVGAIVLSVQLQDGRLCMWAQVEEGRSLETRYFRACETGDPIPEGEPLRFIDTVQTYSGMVYHIFERLYE